MESNAILCVDDDQRILNSLKRLLRKEGWPIFVAKDVKRALSILKTNEISLVLADYRMPEMNGVELLQEVKREKPDTVRTILSAYADSKVVLDAINKGEVVRFFTKPWHDQDLLEDLRICIKQYNQQQHSRKLVEDIKRQNIDLKHLSRQQSHVILEKSLSIEKIEECFDNIPLAAIVIDDQGNVLMINHTAIKNYPSLSQARVGKKIDEIVSHDVLAMILKHSESDKKASSGFFTVDGHTTEVRVESFGDKTPVKDMIVTFEEDHSGDL